MRTWRMQSSESGNWTRLLLFHWSCLLRRSFRTCLTRASLPSVYWQAYCPRSSKWSYLTPVSVGENSSDMKSTYLMKSRIASNHFPALYTHLNIPWCKLQQVLGSKLNTGHSPRQSIIIIIIIIITPNNLKLDTEPALNTLRLFYVFVCFLVGEFTSLTVVQSISLASNDRVNG